MHLTAKFTYRLKYLGVEGFDGVHGGGLQRSKAQICILCV